MDENPRNEANSFDEAAVIGSPSISSIFGAPSPMESTTKGEASLHEGALQQRSIELNKEEKDCHDPTFEPPAISIRLQGATIEEQDSAAGDVNLMANDTENTPGRIPYNNGFGDFYFGHLRKCNKPRITDDMSEEEKLDLMGITGSHGVPVVALDNFQRSGSFPFNKLPCEIREKIIRVLLRPILSIYHDGQKEFEFTDIEIAAIPDPFDDLNYSNEALYDYSNNIAIKKYEAMLFPGRKLLIDVKLDPVRSDWRDLKGPHKDWKYLHWLRQASYVSTSFRHDLGRVLWSRVKISAGDAQEDTFKESWEDDGYFRNSGIEKIFTLIEERPAIIPGIKMLNLKVNIAKGQNISDCSFFDANNCIWEALDLETACFTIKASEYDLNMFMEEEKTGLDGLSVTEKLRVSKFFRVKLKRVYDCDDSDGYDTGDALDLLEYEDAIWEYMLPRSLRDWEPETEEEKYLQERFEEFGDTEQIEEAKEVDDQEQSEDAGEAVESEFHQVTAEAD